MKRQASVVIGAFLLALALAAPALADDVYSPETLKIAHQLQCPVCSGESVADSNSELARQMRAIIEQKVQAGESEQQIKDYFVERYGPSILSDPPKSGFSLALWWVPVLALLLGAAVLGLFLRERVRPRSAAVAVPAAQEDPELEAIAREILGSDGRHEVAST